MHWNQINAFQVLFLIIKISYFFYNNDLINFKKIMIIFIENEPNLEVIKQK